MKQEQETEEKEDREEMNSEYRENGYQKSQTMKEMKELTRHRKWKKCIEEENTKVRNKFSMSSDRIVCFL